MAEKFETIITRGISTTRMRDFYDIFILTTTQPFDSEVFNAALNKTVEKRGTAEQMADINGVIKMVAESPIMIDLWRRYQAKFNYAADVSWYMAIEALGKLVE